MSELLQHADCQVDFDHHTKDFAADPARAYLTAFKECPITWSSRHGGYWIITGYQEAYAALQDDELFSSADGVSIPQIPRKGSPLDVDPPDHQLYRNTMNKCLAPAAVRDMHDELLLWSREALGKVVRAGGGDLVNDVAAPAPAKAIMAVLGLPLDNWQRYADAWHFATAHPTEAQGYRDLSTIWDEVYEVVGEQRSNPGDRLIGRMWTTNLLEQVTAHELKETRGQVTELVHGTESGCPLDPATEEGTHTAMTILAAGVDTTTNFFSSIALWLSQNTDARSWLIEHIDDQEAWDRAMEEFLRYLSTAPGLCRSVTRDAEFFGHQLEAGDRVLISFMAANHDPRVFDRPNEVVLDRHPNRHIAFGVGRHRCIGMHLARDAASIMLRELLLTAPEYQIDLDGCEMYDDRANVAGWVRMPVTVGRVAASACFA